MTAEICFSCTAITPTATALETAVPGINTCFNDLVFIDLFWLKDICLLHEIDVFTRFSIV